jgi:hypothetical protein
LEWQAFPVAQSVEVVVHAPVASHCRLLSVLPVQVVSAGQVSGSGFPFTAVQAPAALQAWQVPAQAESQHTPSAQKPIAHSPPLVQGAPSGLPVAQVPVLDPAGNWQVLGARH